MSFIKKEEKKELKRIEYTHQELDALWEELGHDISEASRIKWLASKKAIKIHTLPRQDGTTYQDIAIIQNSDGSFPYSQLQEKWEALNARIAKREYAQKMNLQQLETLSSSRETLGTLL